VANCKKITEDCLNNIESIKNKKIKLEIKKMNKVFENIPDNIKKVSRNLIENCAFLSVNLEDLKTHINKHGFVSEYQNGANQWGVKDSPEVKVYLAMTKNHTQIMKQLTDLICKNLKVDNDTDDDFEQFVNSRDE